MIAQKFQVHHIFR
uniref:Uncharacterized protein n=1 Tax=Rhizophora mucronata TaxID=61149 RepID=A0A2P2Q2I1_RHIMU